MTYLFSSFTELPDRFFHGYAFCGTDFVSGPGGAAAWARATGGRIESGLDGCYLSLWRTATGHRAGVDAGGLKKLFWYDDGRAWGFSNSVTALARHLSENGVSLRPDPVQLEGLRVNNTTVATQLACFETVIAGIRLLPSWQDLEITPIGLRPALRPAPKPRDYAQMLHDYIELWLRRIETLLIDPRVRLSCDLTGGKDSRVVFALVQKARQRLGPAALADVAFHSSKGERWAKDLQAASLIADRFGVALNPRPTESPEQHRLSAAHVFDRWYDLNVGVYFPIYFPGDRPDEFRIQLHGGGGEKHRPFYKLAGPGEFARLVTQRHDGNHLVRGWADCVCDTLRHLQEQTPGMDPWILHYREFRNRMHGGRSPQYRTVLAPLDGKEPELLSNVAGKSEQAQLHFDVMESLFPGLMHLPYDDPSKGPSPAALQALTLVPVSSGSAPGTAYISRGPLGDNRPEQEESPFALLRKRLAQAGTARVKSLMPEALARAEAAMRAASPRGKFGHAADGKDISRVLAAEFALSFA